MVYYRYGSPEVLELAEVPEPEVAGNRMLIRVAAASVNRSDWETLAARPRYVRLSGGGFIRPKRPILGSDIAGRVEAVGPDVTEFSVGDEVFGDIMWHGASAFAEYVCVPETAPIVGKPTELSFENAASLPQSAVLALQGLRTGRNAKLGDRILVNGAGGGGGTFALQLARLIGAEVTGVDSAAKFDTMRAAGADHVIDYRTEKYTRPDEKYDRIIDFVGSRGLIANRRVLKPDGIYALIGGSLPRLLKAGLVGMALTRLGRRNLGVLVAKPNKDDLGYLGRLVVDGKLQPVVGGTYDLSGVPDALGHLGAGLAKGKLVIRI